MAERSDSAEEQQAGEGEEKTLQQILSEAYEESAAEGAVEGEKPEQGGDRRRDGKGRFAKTAEGATEGEGAAAAEGETQQEPAEGAEKPAQPDPAKPEGEPPPAAEKPAGEKPDPALELSGKLSPADKAMFADLQKGNPRAAQWLLDRHKAMEADHTKKTQAIAEFRREYEPVHVMLQPWGEQMRAAGYTPGKLIQAWAQVEQDLLSGDAARQIGVVTRMVQMYRMPVEKIAAALGVRAAPPAGGAKPAADPAGAAAPGAEGQQPPEIPPAMAPWVQELAALSDWRKQQEQLQQTETQRRQQEAQAQQLVEFQRIGNDIEQFRTAADKDGKTLLHPHFDELEKDITVLAQVARARGERRSLQELYDTAVWANPSTRAKAQAAAEAAQRAKAEAEARAKAANARRAGSSVTGAPTAGQTPKPATAKNASLRDALDAAFEEHSDS